MKEGGRETDEHIGWSKKKKGSRHKIMGGLEKKDLKKNPSWGIRAWPTERAFGGTPT